ncbi:MAG: hypothetical protein OXH07_01315 [Chloroflexi bacterium]|nr:hypothetical protein [Chloroflexota bacterium]
MSPTRSSTQVETCVWTGASGTQYRYEIYPIGTSFNALPGNYIFAKINTSNRWAAIYAGETEDLSTRFDNHHQQACINRHGATHIHVRVNRGGADARRAEERDIRLAYDPPCNRQ